MNIETLLQDLDKTKKLLDEYTYDKNMVIFYDLTDQQKLKLSRSLNTVIQTIGFINENFLNARLVELKQQDKK